MNSSIGGKRWEFPKIRGTLFWGPYNKDPTTYGTIPIFGNSHMVRDSPKKFPQICNVWSNASWEVAMALKSQKTLAEVYTLGALIITNTIMGVPYYNPRSIMGPQTLS